MTTRVWLSALRQGITHHTIDGRHTTCRRYIGVIGDEPMNGFLRSEHGFVLWLGIAERDYATRPCARCYGTADITRRERRSA